jgi:hypothetical protein
MDIQVVRLGTPRTLQKMVNDICVGTSRRTNACVSWFEVRKAFASSMVFGGANIYSKAPDLRWPAIHKYTRTQPPEQLGLDHEVGR